MGSDLEIVAGRLPAILRPIVKPDEMIDAQKEITALIVGALEEGRDYGVAPGTGGKPALLKPGSERLQKAFGCHTVFDVIEKEIDHDREVKWAKQKWEWNNQTRRKERMEVSGISYGLYRYVVRAMVIGPHGQTVGSGIGTCSTLENKYVDRPRDLENTVIKMAQKRAKVGATLDAFALSDRFTQDIDENKRAKSEGPDESPEREKYVGPAPRQQAAKKDDCERFDPKNDAHVERLRKAFDHLKIEGEDLRDKVAHRLIGCPMTTGEIQKAVVDLELPF